MDGNYIDKCIEIFEKYLGKGFFDNDTLDVEALYECYIKNYEDIRKEKFINRRSNENLGNFMVTLYKIYPNLLEEIAKYNSDWTYNYLFSFSTLPVDIIMPNSEYYNKEIQNMFIWGAQNIKTLDFSKVNPECKFLPDFFEYNIVMEKIVFNPNYIADRVFFDDGISPKEIVYRGKSYHSIDELNEGIRKTNGWL